ncbi:hypothetical protein B0H11DRAFT_1945065 [Mycena galericulata]|nr:hypothetical protein B0H11DRAFT_1945065 [Mycena galericulata]
MMRFSPVWPPQHPHRPRPSASPVIDMGAWGTGIPWEWHPSWATSSGPTSNWGTGTGWGDPNGSGWGDGTGWGEPFANTWGAAAAAGTSTGNWGGLASAASSASN